MQIPLEFNQIFEKYPQSHITIYFSKGQQKITIGWSSDDIVSVGKAYIIVKEIAALLKLVNPEFKELRDNESVEKKVLIASEGDVKIIGPWFADKGCASC